MQQIIETLKTLIENENLTYIRETIKNIKNNVKTLENLNNDQIIIDKDILCDELQQILDTKSLDRTKHYIKILHKSLTEIKISNVSDINLNRWKEYNDIWTDSLWLIGKRDSSGVHSSSYHGNYVPQIPQQFIKRYTKKGDWVLDPFLGGGTTLIETQRLGRNGIGFELQEDVCKIARTTIDKEPNNNVITDIVCGDSTEINYKQELDKFGIDNVQLVILHPPYWNIIQFSENKKDLSNCSDLQTFLNMFGTIVDKSTEVLEKGRYMTLIISDMYLKSEWVPLGFYAMQEVLKRNYRLKSIIVKDFNNTKAKEQQTNLWRYRAMIGGFYIFKHEYIFLFEKK